MMVTAGGRTAADCATAAPRVVEHEEDYGQETIEELLRTAGLPIAERDYQFETRTTPLAPDDLTTICEDETRASRLFDDEAATEEDPR